MARLALRVKIDTSGLKKKSTRLIKELREAVAEQTDYNLKRAREFTSTQYHSTKQLKALDHPYARRNAIGKKKNRPGMMGTPFNRPYILNRQSGLLTRQIRKSRPGKGGLSQTVFIPNGAVPYAKYMTKRGTSRMVPRPLFEQVRKVGFLRFWNKTNRILKKYR